LGFGADGGERGPQLKVCRRGNGNQLMKGFLG
jgi:hypothetical protein